MNNIEQHKKIIDDLHSTYIAKNKDYGNSFSQSFDEFGIVSALVRMSDKWNRLKNLSKCDEVQVKDESIRDTLLDLSNYAIMTVMELDRKENNTNKEKFNEKLIEELTERVLDQKEDAKKNAAKGIDANKVMSLYNAGWSMTKIAEEMGCSQPNISQIIKMRRVKK